MDDDSIPYKDGFLLLPPQGMLGQLKKSWQRRRCQLFRAGQRGIARLEVWEDERGASQRIITLQDCVKITPDLLRSQPNAFTIVNKSGDHALAAVEAADTADWIAALQTVAFRDHCGRGAAVEEDNDLYCSAAEEGVFAVTLVATEASRRCGLAPGGYSLTAGAAALLLRDLDGVLRASWPYKFIRRYGYREGAFTLEAGRLCSTGEGSFRLDHAARRDIYRCISARMRDMRNILGADDVPLAAAAGLEARTRSPLPPGPATACRPQKPPRKHVPTPAPTYPTTGQTYPTTGQTYPTTGQTYPATGQTYPTTGQTYPTTGQTYPTTGQTYPATGQTYPAAGQAYTAPSPPIYPAYDSVEVRTDAWRTLGTNDTERSERPLIELQEDNGTTYDTLQHLGPKSRPDPGYRSIPVRTDRAVDRAVDRPPPVDRSARPDRLGSDREEPGRGYGVIRKTALAPAHVLKNEAEYALVEKPRKN